MHVRLIIFSALSLTLSGKARCVFTVQSSGMSAKSFAPQCRCSPKLPEGAKTASDETRVKQHFAEAGDTGVSVCTGAPRSWTFRSFFSFILTSVSSSLCAVHLQTSEEMHTLTHTGTHAQNKVLPPFPSSPAATLRERSKISLNKEASGDRQTAPAPPFKQGWWCGW